MAKNCTLNAPNYGATRVTCISVSYGNHIIYHEEMGRFYKAMYLDKQTQVPFTLGLDFSDHGDYQHFGRWMQAWGDLIANPDFAGGKPTGPMEVTIPVIGFHKWGVLTSGVSFGRKAGDVTWRMSLTFQFAKDASETALNTTQSTTRGVSGDTSLEAQYFYPWGKQLSGSQPGLDYIYESDSHLNDVPASLNSNPSTPSSGPRSRAF